MQCVKGPPGHLAGDVQIAQIGPGVPPARIAGAPRIGGARVLGEPRLLDRQRPLARQELAVAGVAGRQHAIEQIDAVGHAFHEVVRHSRPHQIPHAVVRQQRRGARRHLVHDVHRLAHAQAADGVAVEPEGHRLPRAALPKAAVDAPLHDAELHLTGVGRLAVEARGIVADREKTGAAPAGPAQGPPHRGLGLRLRHRVARALVEHHGDIGPEPGLDVRGALRGQPLPAAVEMRPKPDAVLVDVPAVAEAEHLVAPAVGQDRPVPADEAVQAAGPRHEPGAGTQMQVIGVGEDELRPQAEDVAMRQSLDGPPRAHRRERRGPDHPVRGAELARARPPIAVGHSKREAGIGWRHRPGLPALPYTTLV